MVIRWLVEKVLYSPDSHFIFLNVPGFTSAEPWLLVMNVFPVIGLYHSGWPERCFFSLIHPILWSSLCSSLYFILYL